MNARFSHYVRQTLKNADDINATAEELYKEHPSQEARDLILDIYILQAERRAGTHEKQFKEKWYDCSYSRQNRKTQFEIADRMVNYGAVDISS